MHTLLLCSPAIYHHPHSECFRNREDFLFDFSYAFPTEVFSFNRHSLVTNCFRQWGDEVEQINERYYSILSCSVVGRNPPGQELYRFLLIPMRGYISSVTLCFKWLIQMDVFGDLYPWVFCQRHFIQKSKYFNGCPILRTDQTKWEQGLQVSREHVGGSHSEAASPSAETSRGWALTLCRSSAPRCAGGAQWWSFSCSSTS